MMLNLELADTAQERDLGIIAVLFPKSSSLCVVADKKAAALGIIRKSSENKADDNILLTLFSWVVPHLECCVCSLGSVSQEGLRGVGGDMGEEQ